jgi:hypothetical protein
VLSATSGVSGTQRDSAWSIRCFQRRRSSTGALSCHFTALTATSSMAMRVGGVTRLVFGWALDELLRSLRDEQHVANLLSTPSGSPSILILL